MTNRKFTPPDPGEVREYVTRDGQEARAYICGGFLCGDVDGVVNVWNKRGQQRCHAALTLFDKPKTRDVTVWVSSYEDGAYLAYQAKPTYLPGKNNSLTKHTLTITEGQFDED